jgi:predicted phosphodiesterase
MTRLAVLADIHGNLPALEAILDDLAGRRVDQVVVAGDVINWGPFSEGVLERIAREGWAVLRGNHEFYLLDYDTPRAPALWADPARFPLLPRLRRELGGRWQSRIAAWPDTLRLCFPDAPPLRVVHGSPRSPWEGVSHTADDRAAAMLAGVEEETVVAGHTHRAVDRAVGRWRILNPGSAGVPLDGCFSASYLLLDGDADGWRPTFRRVPFDYAPLFAEFERGRFVEECGVIGWLVREEFRTARLQIVPFLRWRAACCPDAPLSLDLLDAYAQIDPWDYTPAGFQINRG